MKESYVVIGCGRFGKSVAKTLYDLGHDVLAVDSDMNTVEEIADNVSHAVQCDATDEQALRSLGVSNYDVAIVSLTESMESSIIATLLLKEIGVPYIICKAKNDLQGKMLSKIGADQIVYPERDMGEWLANRLTSKNVLDIIDLNSNYSIVEINVAEDWIGKSLIELRLREKHGLNVIAIKNKKKINITPSGDERIHKSDTLVVVSEHRKLKHIDKLYE